MAKNKINIIRLINEFKLEIIMTICMFSSLYPQLPTILYYAVTFMMLGYLAHKSNVKPTGPRASLTIALIAVTCLSSLINNTITYRLGTFIFVFCTALVFRSYKYYIYKVRFMYIAMLGFAITPILNLYAYVNGINYIQIAAKANHVFLSEFDFSGFTCLGMWLSPACGIATIFFVHLIISVWNTKGLLWALPIVPLVFISIYVTTLGGSRSALGLSLLASGLLVWLGNKKASHTIIIAILFAIGTVVALPKIIEGSTRMQMKGTDISANMQKNSRTELWNARFEEFEESPIWGIGFSATGVGDNQRVGGAETGSGWLTALSQAGAVGFILCIMITSKAYVPLKKIREDDKMTLFFSVLVFMALHTIFEAYLFQAGWYLCLVYWMLVGILDDYKKYGPVKLIE